MRALQRRLLGEGEEVAVPPDSPHFKLIQAVFRLHPHYAQKAQEPITSFFVVRNPFVLGGRGCEFQYEDQRGVRDDFSLLKCTRPPLQPTSRLQLLEACAHEVEPQLRAAAVAAVAAQQWRQQEYGDGGDGGGGDAPLCCRCGSDFKVAVSYSGWPLSKLMHAFRESDAPSRAPVRFAVHPHTRQAVFSGAPADAAWAAAWRAYHQRHARLELLCKCCAGAQADARRARRWEAQHAGMRNMHVTRI
ncbi:hypothetical protein C2E20_8524 [Micractinium conductrix]|uniref:Uncharacterized protein n=1 Tax=Micractinium conductrix TaxID=554055 RepID=A0A2P6V189_9CHLO|nr:hypothetical protein C2E20_8524 [Micractinium conductrix]|eukprot:PSC67859.1 hypothetical protein C2E20_8524 [Micractinium conductrix]